jgi:Trp operon repressor
MKKQLPNTGKKENTVLLKLLQKMNEQQTIAELVETLQTRLEKGQFRDAVHKIKLMTTLETVQRMLNGK